MRLALALLAIGFSGAGLTVRLRGALRLPAAILLGLGAWSAAWAATLMLFGRGALPAKDITLTLFGTLLLLYGSDHRSHPPSGNVNHVIVMIAHA